MAADRRRYPFSGQSIRRRIILVAMATSFAALVLYGLGVYSLDLRRTRKDMATQMELLARNLAYHSLTPLAFYDRESAEETLASLSIYPSIPRACIHDSEGDVFASFAVDASLDDLHPGTSAEGGHVFENDRLYAWEPILIETQLIGMVVIESDLSRIVSLRQDYVRIALIALLVGLGLSAIIALRLSRVITGPIGELSGAALRVKETQDYSARVVKHAADELGLFIDSFNDMLAEIERRDQEISEARDNAQDAALEASRQANEIELANVQLKAEMEERRRLEEQLLQAQKMESIGQLAGGVAHDFNNILTVILGWSDLAEDQAAESPELLESIGEIRRSAERAANLTRQLLAFARRQVIEPRPVSLNELIRGIEKLLVRVIGEDIDLVIELGDDLRTIHVDPGQFDQILMNLAVNARDAMPRGGTLRITTRNAGVPRGHLPLGEADSDEFVLMSVSDTGEGMSSEIRSRIFEPFFTTKAKGKGTGLGLSVCYGIVSQNDGMIEVDSEPGEGTEFRIYIPVTPEAPRDAPSGGAIGMESSSAVTILAVEDEPSVRGLIHSVLEARGHRVLLAEDGVEAMGIAEKFEGEIDLLITDVVMPRMGGRELAEQIRRAQPTMRVLFTSGYPDQALGSDRVLAPGLEFLPKPFTPDGLVRKVEQVVSRSDLDSRP